MKLATICSTVILGAALSGCATIFEGTSQTIYVVTNPPGAHCVLERLGMAIGTVSPTPGQAKIRKNKYDIMVKCDKSGYQEADYLNHSGTSALIAANVAADVLLTAGISSIVDSADGADNKYDGVVNLTLTPLDRVPASAAIPPDTSTAPVSGKPAS